MTHEDRLRIALRVIETGELPEQPPRLTRRTRQIVVAFDVLDNHAWVWIVRRAHGNETADVTMHFERADGGWRYSGGGGGEPGADLSERVTRDELQDRPAWMGDRIPFGRPDGGSYGQSSGCVRFQVIPECVEIAVEQDRRPVAAHGYCLVGWEGRRRPAITGHDAAGNDLGSFTPEGPSRRGPRPRFGRTHGVAPLLNRRRVWFPRRWPRR